MQRFERSGQTRGKIGTAERVKKKKRVRREWKTRFDSFMNRPLGQKVQNAEKCTFSGKNPIDTKMNRRYKNESKMSGNVFLVKSVLREFTYYGGLADAESLCDSPRRAVIGERLLENRLLRLFKGRRKGRVGIDAGILFCRLLNEDENVILSDHP